MMDYNSPVRGPVFPLKVKTHDILAPVHSMLHILDSSLTESLSFVFFQDNNKKLRLSLSDDEACMGQLCSICMGR